MTPTPSEAPKGAEARYAVLQTDREQFLNRARQCAAVTIPTLVPPDGANSSTVYDSPWQDVGPRGVNNLAAKLLLALFPLESAFFRWEPDANLINKMKDDGQTELVEQIQLGLSRAEQTVHKAIHNTADRNTLFECLKHLLVAGNGLLWMPDKGGVKLFPLAKYVVQRDQMGNVLEIVLCERVAKAALPQDILDVLPASSETTKDATTEVDIYTWVRLKDNKWLVHQEVKGQELPGTRSKYKADRCPYIPLRLVQVSGENYGRGFVEEYFGPLNTLEGLHKAITEGSLAMSQIIPLIRPSSTIKPSDITQGRNGQPVYGEPDDLTFAQFNKAPEFGVAWNLIGGVTRALEQSFMLGSGIQRDAERVTAEEIRVMAAELEQALGGIYSLLGHELQLPYLKRKITQLVKAKVLAKEIPESQAKPSIVAGLQGIGRSQEFQRIVATTQALSAMFTPEVVAQRLKLDTLMTKAYSAGGVDPKEIVKTAEEVAREQQQAQQAAMTQTIAPHLAKGGADMMKSQMETQAAPAA